jgi:hypothetical protein
MDFSKLIRDPAKIHSCLRELPDERLVAVKPVKIYIPTRFAERNLAAIGIETNIVGIFAMVAEDTYYAVSLVNAMVRIDPTSTVKVMVDDTEYYEFLFVAGSTVLPSVQLVKNDTLVYRIYDEIISKGRIPHYLNYMDLSRIFDTAKFHAGANIGTSQEVTELIISLIARDAKERHTYYREVCTSNEYLEGTAPAFIPLRSVTYSATNTTNKMAGSYYHEGVVSALVSPSTRQEKIEKLLTR